MRAVAITGSALDDMAAAWRFYEATEQGAGDYFEHSMKREIASLASIHGIHRLVHGFHRMTVARFPFAVFYREEESVTLVVAVLDTRRDPDWIRSQLNNR